MIKQQICHVAFSKRNTSGKVLKRKRRPKSCCVSLHFFETIILMNVVMVSEQWKENFQMNKENFLKLCNELRPYMYIQKKLTNMR